LEPTTYRITVRGRLTKRLVSAFEGLNVEPGIEQTVLIGEIRDQSHLYGVLDLMRELGLDLVSVETNRGRPGPGDKENPGLTGQCGAVQPLLSLRGVLLLRLHRAGCRAHRSRCPLFHQEAMPVRSRCQGRSSAR